MVTLKMESASSSRHAQGAIRLDLRQNRPRHILLNLRFRGLIDAGGHIDRVHIPGSIEPSR